MTLEFIIPSEFSAGREVQEQVLAQLHKHGYNCDCAFAIRLALEEALINAIKHGNHCDPRKKVHVKAQITPKQAEIVVEDEGEGFSRAGVPDPRAHENLERLNGRGIFLMEAYMNKVEWSCGGRRVRMVKRNVGEGQAARKPRRAAKGH